MKEIWHKRLPLSQVMCQYLVAMVTLMPQSHFLVGYRHVYA